MHRAVIAFAGVIFLVGIAQDHDLREDERLPVVIFGGGQEGALDRIVTRRLRRTERTQLAVAERCAGFLPDYITES